MASLASSTGLEVHDAQRDPAPRAVHHLADAGHQHQHQQHQRRRTARARGAPRRLHRHLDHHQRGHEGRSPSPARVAHQEVGGRVARERGLSGSATLAEYTITSPRPAAPRTTQTSAWSNRQHAGAAGCADSVPPSRTGRSKARARAPQPCRPVRPAKRARRRSCLPPDASAASSARRHEDLGAVARSCGTCPGWRRPGSAARRRPPAPARSTRPRRPPAWRAAQQRHAGGGQRRAMAAASRPISATARAWRAPGRPAG
jgi:hypothetical protein